MPPKKELYTHIMYCNYGKNDTIREIRRSFSEKSAENSWKKLFKNFSHSNWRCWQINKKGEIIRDSKNTLQK